VTETLVDKPKRRYGNFKTYGEAVNSHEIRAGRYLREELVEGAG
jgi:hypothetical protein